MVMGAMQLESIRRREEVRTPNQRRPSTTSCPFLTLHAVISC